MAFKILSATFLQDGKHSFTLDFSKPENEIQDTQFTLLIGKNGVGKSLILEAIIDFLFYVWVKEAGAIRVRFQKYISCTALVYMINGAVCKLDGLKGTLHFYKNGKEYPVSPEWLPKIVATSFSICDKFKVPRSFEREKWDFYKYIGAKVNGNMISPTSILFTLLCNIASASKEQLSRINSAINAIGYELCISFRFKLQAVNDKFTFGDDFLFANPYFDKYSKHIEIRNDILYHGISKKGIYTVDKCHLNRMNLTIARAENVIKNSKNGFIGVFLMINNPVYAKVVEDKDKIIKRLHLKERMQQYKAKHSNER